MQSERPNLSSFDGRNRTNHGDCINSSSLEFHTTSRKQYDKKSVKKSLDHEESAKMLEKKQSKIKRRMHNRGIFSDAHLSTSADGTCSTSRIYERNRRLSLPLVQVPPSTLADPRLRHLNNSRPYHKQLLHSSPQDSGVVMEPPDPVVQLSNSLDNESTMACPLQVATAQEQFRMSFINNSTGKSPQQQASLSSSPPPQHLGEFEDENGDCVVCNVLHSTPSGSDQQSSSLRDSGLGNELNTVLQSSSTNSREPELPHHSTTQKQHPGSRFLNKSLSEVSDGMAESRLYNPTDFFEATDNLAKENAHFQIAELLISAAEEYKCSRHEKLVFGEDDALDCMEDTPDHILSSPFQGGDSASSAENTANRLLQDFRGMTSPVLSILEHLHSSIASSSRNPDSVSSKLTLHRGNSEWAPPRQQVIFTIPPNLKRHEVLKQQDYRCAGCGMKVDRDLSRHFRYCHYSGKYFCLSCHDDSQAVLPAMVLNKWIFKKFSISKYARTILDRTSDVPMFHIDGINPELYSRSAQLTRIRDVRQQLMIVRKYLTTCKYAKQLYGRYTTMGHVVSDMHSYSLADLINVHAGQSLRPLKELLNKGVEHVRSCDLCKERGFICEFCKNPQDILYPFEIVRVQRCQCGACFHRACNTDKKRSCPRCHRLKLRKETRIQETNSTID